MSAFEDTAARKRALQEGLIECRNLQETLQIDIPLLFTHVIPGCKFDSFDHTAGITKKYLAAAACLHSLHGFEIFKLLSTHRSDTVRGVSCYLLGLQQIPLHRKLEYIRPLADDLNSGVREWAWIALRPSLIEELDAGLEYLSTWIFDRSERIRRFASEFTRPRGVWSPHINELRKRPERALHLLEPLRSDPARYVQLSVGNWLNDAGKDNPEWVIQCCKRWNEESPTIETQKITKRALRTIQKKKA